MERRPPVWRKVGAVTGGKDMSGDGSVVMPQMPGETALMVNLAKAGPVILSGDVVHFAEQADRDGVTVGGFERADRLA